MIKCHKLHWGYSKGEGIFFTNDSVYIKYGKNKYHQIFYGLCCLISFLLFLAPVVFLTYTFIIDFLDNPYGIFGRNSYIVLIVFLFPMVAISLYALFTLFLCDTEIKFNIKAKDYIQRKRPGLRFVEIRKDSLINYFLYNREGEIKTHIPFYRRKSYELYLHKRFNEGKFRRINTPEQIKAEQKENILPNELPIYGFIVLVFKSLSKDDYNKIKEALIAKLGIKEIEKEVLKKWELRYLSIVDDLIEEKIKEQGKAY